MSPTGLGDPSEVRIAAGLLTWAQAEGVSLVGSGGTASKARRRRRISCVILNQMSKATPGLLEAGGEVPGQLRAARVPVGYLWVPGIHATRRCSFNRPAGRRSDAPPALHRNSLCLRPADGGTPRARCRRQHGYRIALTEQDPPLLLLQPAHKAIEHRDHHSTSHERGEYGARGPLSFTWPRKLPTTNQPMVVHRHSASDPQRAVRSSGAYVAEPESGRGKI